VLLEGQAEVIRDGSVVAQLGPGDHFGELAHLQGVPRAATVRALTPVRVFRISPAGFDHLISASLRSTSANPLIAAAAREN
jgi:CRP-like cAMP-binding protein